MRASRLLSTLLLLQARGRMTAQQIADELEVSVRTVYRDVEALSAAGVPVYADRGPAGGYQLVDGYRTRLTGLTADEAGALFIGGGPSAASELGLGTVLAAAQLKLLAALPPDLRSRAARIRERFHIDAPGWFREPDSPPHLDQVAEAVWQQRRILVEYEKWDKQQVRRTIEPLGLVLKGVAWYVVARRNERVNAYRVSRISAVSTLDEHFERPGGFDLTSYWAEWSKRLQATLFRGGDAVIRLSPQGIGRLFMLGAVVERAFRETVGRPDADGWVRAVVPIESFEHAVADFLRLAGEIEVLEPVELRDLMCVAALSIARRHGADVPPAL